MSNSICFYHDDSDGVLSASIVKTHYPKAKFVRVQYGSEEKALENLEEKHDFIFVVDFSFSSSDMTLLMKKAEKEFVWIDHHKSAMEKLEMLWNSNDIGGLRDITKSGSLLTWEWFNPHTSPPDCVRYVNDYDLWKHEFPETKSFHIAFVLLYPEPLDIGLITYTSSIINLGDTLIKAQNNRVKKTFKNGFYGYVDTLKAYFVNTPNDISETGNYILENTEAEIAVVYFDTEYYTTYSLRSRGAFKSIEEIDVSIIAKERGGGGHKNAAGFRYPLGKRIWTEENE